MDVVLGVAVTGRVARLAMIGSSDSSGQVFDQYALDLTDDAATDLAETIVGTYRAVAESGNRLAATRLCLPDASEAETLRQTVSNAGVQNVEVVAETEAAAALARSVGADAALLLADDDTVALAVVGEDEESTSVLASMPIGSAGAAVACAAVLAQVPESTTRVMLCGQRLDLDSVAAELSSTMAVEVPPDPGFAIARGAAQTADHAGFAPAGAATQMGPAASDATALAPVSDATQMGPAARRDGDGAGFGCDADGDGCGRGSWAAAGLLAGRAGLLRDARRVARGVRSGAGGRGDLHRGDRAATAKDTARGQCDGVPGDELHDAGRRGRGQHPAGRRRRSAAGTARAVGYGAGALPAAGAARAGSGGVAGRGGVAGARRSSGSACPDQPGAGAQ